METHQYCPQWAFDGDDYKPVEPGGLRPWGSPAAHTGPVLADLQSSALVERDGVVYRRNRVLIPRLLKGDLPVALPSEPAPSCTWLGPRIPNALLRTILAWFHKHRAGECQGKLFYHPARREWDFEPLPQLTPHGMTTKECPDDPRTAEILGRRGRQGWALNGTVHHHCSISAFQSGTDESDEESSNGLHITIGKLNAPVADWHARYVNKKCTYQNLPIEAWIETPDLQLTELPPYPEAWDSIFVPRTYQSPVRVVEKVVEKVEKVKEEKKKKSSRSQDITEELLVFFFESYLEISQDTTRLDLEAPENDWDDCIQTMEFYMPRCKELDDLEQFGGDWINETGVHPVLRMDQLENTFFNVRYHYPDPPPEDSPLVPRIKRLLTLHGEPKERARIRALRTASYAIFQLRNS
jgi:hypothetical protein